MSYIYLEYSGAHPLVIVAIRTNRVRKELENADLRALYPDGIYKSLSRPGT
jgi:hypothetical protein